MRARQVELTQLRESINRLTAGQESPELMEVGRLRCAWLDLGRQAAQLLEQKEEDLQRSGDYHDCICMVEELFDQLSKKWDQLARHATFPFRFCTTYSCLIVAMCCSSDVFAIHSSLCSQKMLNLF